MSEGNISIIIPAFNCAGWIRATLESCLAQTRRPAEIIVVDDGSTDRTGDVCGDFSESVRFVKVANGGVSRARNIGAKIAGGKWVLFLDADDILIPQATEWLVERAEKESAGVAYGMVTERAQPGQLARLNGFNFAAGDPPFPAKQTLKRGAIITPGSAVVRADLHPRVGGFVSGYEPMEDRDYWAKCGCLERVAFCDSVVLDKTWRPVSHGSQHAKRIFRGQRAQRDLRGWLAKREVDTSWMPSDAEFFRWALDEAVWRRCPEIIPPLRKLAKAEGVRHWRSFLYSLAVRRPLPDWIGVEPKVLEE
ncbi:MAG: glycosyltransferase family A protein [Verrucomicrobia bacterium]|nr:glycosyltransferase family A protein [Verrucomicrobiota bacterium]